ncbi:sensor histidine kinase [Lutispora thermophila]|uniref:GHKL domain-containing protein n=1 Tax=Lutispora thermophila DSM 19022 TaxID=1122184 RepID=A0A1M6DP15_9FIRM|nr:GHKL domain-containing protein [Lutispora thermophila]SHI74728.1 GHKL domain-containing protein [Lutispora thermophila DSM 19022]
MLLIANFFVSLITGAMFYISAIRLLSCDFNKRKAILFISCYAFCNALIRSNKYYDNITSLMKLFFVMTVVVLLTNAFIIRDIIKSFYYTVLVYTVALINESVVVFLMVKIFDISLKAMQNHILYMTIASLSVFWMTYIAIIAMKYLWDKKKNIAKSIKNGAYIIFALLTFMVTAANILVYNKYMEMIDSRLIFINILITFLYFLLTIAVYRIYSNLAINEQENKQLKAYINMAEELIDEYRRIRHNTHNIIESASAFIEANDMEGLKEHLSSVIERQNRINKNNIASLYKIAHPGVKGLLYSKIGKMEELSLNINVEITTDMEHINVNVSDLCEILGVFLDNSIEAARLTKDKYVELCIFEDNECYTIVIKNSYDMNQKKDGNGIGLKTVKSILKKYPNMLNNTIIDEKYYTQELLIKK